MSEIRAVKINNTLSLIEASTGKNNQISLVDRSQVNHIWIYDRSGSMYSVLDGLCVDMIQQSKEIPFGDTLTIGWFSGQGQRGFILKGFKINEKSDFPLVENILTKNNNTIGATCFSESLEDLPTVLNDLSVFSSNFSLAFFTDGYPVVNDYKEEVHRIMNAITQVKGKLGSALYIGYGESYNKQLLMEMAERTGGSMLHSKDLQEFKVALHRFVSSANLVGKIDIIPLMNDFLVAYSIHKNKKFVDLAVYSPSEKLSIRADTSKIYYLVRNNSSSLKEIIIDDTLSDESFLEGLYGAAVTLLQKVSAPDALDVLALLGDKFLIDLVINSYTNGEYGFAEKKIIEAIGNPEKRYLGGKAKNYLPREDAFCLLDLINLLMDDKEAKFYPRNKYFVYKKISKTRPLVVGYPEFKADPSAGVAFSSLTWNKEKLNLSILARISGTIDLPKEQAAALELPNPYHTQIYRNYSIIKNGLLNLEQIPITCSESTKIFLKNLKLIDIDNLESGIMVLNLSSLPTINRNMAKNSRSANKIAIKTLEELRLECIMKVLNYYEREEKSKTIKINDSSQEFLESNGIKGGSFNPPTQSSKDDDVKDYEIVRSFEIKIKGASTLPKVDEIIGKRVSNKPLTTLTQKFMGVGLDLYDNTKDRKKLLEETKKQLAKIRSYIYPTKFALLLSKNWFEEFSSREDCKLTVKEKIGEVEVTTDVIFVVSEDKVLID